MKLTLLSLTTLALFAFAQAQNATYIAGLVQALNSSGLTQLATVTASINSTALGQQLISALPTRNWTIFAPDDNACTPDFIDPFRCEFQRDSFLLQSRQFPPTSPPTLLLSRRFCRITLSAETLQASPRSSRM